MTKTSQDLNWQDLDVNSLSAEQRKAYENYKAAYKLMKEARGVFETGMQEGVPEGYRLVCSYNFGKLRAALAVAEPSKVKAKAAGTLAEFIKAQMAAGRAV